MSQNLKQNALGRKMLHRFCRCLMGLGMALALWNSSLFIPLAQAAVVEYKASYNEGYGAFDNPDEKQAVENALAYISSLLSDGTGAYHEINISVDKRNDDMSSGALAHAKDNHISINTNYNNDFTYQRPTQIASLNIPDNKQYNLTSILFHEMGHNLGISADAIGGDDGTYTVKAYYWAERITKYDKSLFYMAAGEHEVNIMEQTSFWTPIFSFEYNTPDGTKNGIFTFHGTNADYVYNDGGAIEQYVPVENGQSGKDYWSVNSGSSITHPYTYHGVMNCAAEKTERPFFSEVELAVLKDVGNNINLKDHFGQSYYLSHGEITNTNGFNSNAMYGVGLHIVAANNQVTQAASIYATGLYGSGIYSEGNNNAVTINPGVTVSATGEGGIGVLFLYNEDYVLDEYGNTIEILDKHGKIVDYKKKDNKARYLTNMGTIQGSDYGIYIDKELKTINNTGTITAYTADEETKKVTAVKITANGSVTNFNIMGNSQINGDITGSIEKLNFGKIANADGTQGTENDPSFNGTVNGNITSSSADMIVHSGNLVITGKARVHDITVKSNATFNGNGAGIIDANELSNYGTLKNFDLIDINDLNNDGSINSVSKLKAYKNLDNNGNIDNVTMIDCLRSFTNDGNLRNVSRVDVSDNFDNYGNMTNVSTVNSNQLYNMGVGSMTNVSAVNSNSFQNRGNLTVGEAGAIGTMDVEGFMYTNGTLNIDANLQAKPPVSGTTADLITVSENGTAGANDGKMLINGGQININELHSTGSSYYRADINHNIIETENGVDVAIELKAKESGFDIPLFKPVIGHDDKNVWVGLQRDFLYGPAAQTGNQEALGYYIDEIGKTPNPEGDLFPVLIQLDSLNGDKEAGIVSPRALHALEEMSGAVYGTLTSLANQHATMVNNSLAKRLRCWSPCEVIGNNWNLWGEGYGIGGNAVSDGNANGYNYTVGGMLIGIDRQINFNGRFGFYFAVGNTNANVKGLSESADSTDIFLGLYFNHKGNFGWYTTMFAGFGNSDYDVERNFSFIPRSNKSSFNSTQFSAYLERGKNFSLSNIWVLQPFGGLQFISSDRGAVQEHGADLLDLTIAGASMSSLRSLLGIKLSTVNCVTGQKLNYEFSAAWMHEFLDTTSAVSAQMSNPGGTYFESSPTFTVLGNNDGRDWVVAGVGLNYAFTDYFKLFGGYDCMVNGVGSMHRGNLGLEIKR